MFGPVTLNDNPTHAIFGNHAVHGHGIMALFTNEFVARRNMQEWQKTDEDASMMVIEIDANDHGVEELMFKPAEINVETGTPFDRDTMLMAQAMLDEPHLEADMAAALEALYAR